MKALLRNLRQAFAQLIARPRRDPLAEDNATAEQPLRAELFSADQMERHGKSLAGGHTLGTGRGGDQLLARLAENEAILLGACDLLRTAAKANRRITPAGEWLLDNFYLIEEQIRTAKRHFPVGYSRELPLLAGGPSAGLPRVYDIALEAISHGDGRVDPESLDRFVAAYQQVSTLRLGELWAIPIMLRLALIENLRRVGARVAAGMQHRDEADVWADQMIGLAENDPKNLILATADMARSNPPMVNSFVAELARRLQGHSSALALPLTWIEQRLSESGLTIEQLVQSETQSLAANQVSISNSIGSLRFLGAMDWREFVEAMSAVEQKLREDPGGTYGRMTFATRDRYRHAIERIAKNSGLSECDVARKAIQLANRCDAGMDAVNCADERTSHVGHYLVGKGVPSLEHAVRTHAGALELICGAGGRFPLQLYLGAVAVLTAAIVTVFFQFADADGLGGGMLLLAGAAALLGASQLAVALVNWLATLMAMPHPLPRMDYSDGIPPESRTLVVVPAMLTSLHAVDGLAEALEVRFLANRDPNLHFGLLTDYRDAAEETLAADAPLLQRARERIEALNLKYCETGTDAFFLFHRPRQWNAAQRTWMGYERKRGKLGDLNTLLLTGSAAAFSLVVGDTRALRETRFVITLDTDTQLPRDSAREFAGTMAHPLNRARYDEARKRVVDGYGILQPRMSVSLPSASRSRYALLWCSEPGIDPYTRAVSDVYQDLFGEGSFTGKGIYDVEAFELSLKGRFPENRILSHDLLEGCYARAGLLSDAQLYESFPSSYLADSIRRYRWIRGDWQIASWLLKRVPGPGAARLANPLSGLSQWKILDNLRRSLVPAALVALLVGGWVAIPSFTAWTLLVIGMIVLPQIVTSGLEALRKPRDALTDRHLSAVLRASERQFSQLAFSLACLPHEASYSVDAILRTSVRVLLSGRRLLEWTASSEQPGEAGGLARTFAAMWACPVLAIAVAAWLAHANPAALAVAAPVLWLWLAAPVIAWWMSSPLTRREARLRPDQMVFLQRLARRTWSFFETFVTAGEHWLPPDNFQEHPVAAVAHRTSPTNMGLALLANLSAYDFGYISAGKLVERTGNALAAMQALDRYQGHFYNWYDTLTLKPLPPLYISSVDSGNLSGHLLTLRPGLLGLMDHPILNLRTFEGLGDAMGILAEAAAQSTPADSDRPLEPLRRDIESAFDARPASLGAARKWLEKLVRSATALSAHPAATGETGRWTQAVLLQCRDALEELDFLVPAGASPSNPVPAAIPTLRELAAQGNPRAIARIAVIEGIARLSGRLASVDHGLLYDTARHLMTVGYNVEQHRRDAGHYDLLASEARLCSFVAIAQGEVPQESWFALGRLLTVTGGEQILLSWSGSMFEYLMPMLVMPSYEGTLLDQTCHAAVKRQIAYAAQRGVPWGISESGYNTVDASLNYQYRAFGVPGLGLKRGLAEDLVVAPYASALALMVLPEAACQNLQRLIAEGMLGDYGMYEAVDYTSSRLPRGQESAVIRSFMAHHQGMSLLSIASLLLGRPMQKRFESDPLFQATSLLLQERIPTALAFNLHNPDLSDIRTASSGPEMPVRILNTPDTAVPEVQLLSNGRYHVMVTNAGGGYSRCRDLAVTRWREDTTRDPWGTFLYVRDIASGSFWSAAHQPTLRRADTYEAIFSDGRAEFRRRDNEFETHTEIVVSPEDDIELRRSRITNRSRTRRTIDVTSYAEVVLASPASDALHPAFSNLFVQTEILPDRQAILCTRRPRSTHEPTRWMFHLLAVHGADSLGASYETDRSKFIGRTRTVVSPQSMITPGALSGTQGSVLDPVAAIRHRITLEPEQTVTIDLVCGVGDTRDAVLGLAGKYRDRHLADRVFDLAWTHSWVNLQQINATESDAQLYARLAGSVIYANPKLRADAGVLARNRRGQSGLWSYAISGDLPIVLLQIGDLANIELVRQLVQAHAYWRLKGLAVDLVIWNEDRAGYRQVLQEQIMGLIAAGVGANLSERPGGIFVRAAEQIPAEDRMLFQAVARAIVTDTRGSLAEQISRRTPKEARDASPPRLVPTRPPAARPAAVTVQVPQDLLLANGHGGFSPDGRAYVITTAAGLPTPAPWSNVIANAGFGTVVSESGAAYTWRENAHEFRFTPWENDPVSDACGEAFYLRDEETGSFWSPTPLPCAGSGPYVTRHGFGYSVFEHTEDGIVSELTVYVDPKEAVKFSVLKVRNDSGRARQLSATGYVEWVLGDLRPKTAMHIATEIDPASGAICARNPYSPEFPDRIAFFDADGATRAANVTVSGDRGEFLGRNGTLRNPAAMARTKLSNRVGAGLDPCAALRIPFDIGQGQAREFVFRLGAAGPRGSDGANELPQRLHGPQAAHDSLGAVRAYWVETLGTIQVETPDASLNVMCNGWLLYQTLASRLWARSGYYQSGGAFGFRDQLQDTMALVHAEPRLAREHLLRCAARQFSEGDVQHWWHPPAGRGVRTHCSDDLLWLPQAACRYVQVTGDAGVLNESTPFLEGRPVNPADDSYYDLPALSGTRATLYQHCVRALLLSLRFGEHGLPLMGSGDWNDGMNLVGLQGRGESVWLGFFLYDTLTKFTALALAQGDGIFAGRCRAEAEQLKRNLEQHGWDGDWYRRAYFDDGSPLGSASNPECRIDSISQSWAVMSGAGDATRVRTAMASLDQHLVRRDAALIQLLDPPFDTSPLDPGYIKGYLPGVRENGGQYTHAAIWAAMAYAALGDNARAWELFDMINPVNHANSTAGVETYKVEPYVMAADVYARPPHSGRGGWTWYTGSAGWMYRLALESLLGLQVEGSTLRLAPCLPPGWAGYKLRYRHGGTTYAIQVIQSGEAGAPAGVTLDGIEQADAKVSLVDDHAEHRMEVRVRKPRT